MGHVRLGRLPSSRDWWDIMGHLAAGDISIADLADAVAAASDKSLMKAIRDPTFVEAMWLLLSGLGTTKTVKQRGWFRHRTE